MAEGTLGGERKVYAKHTWGTEHLATLSRQQNSVHFGVGMTQRDMLR